MVGLGKLGLPVATAMAARGLTVYGYDPKVSGYPKDLSYEDGFAEAVEQAEGRVGFCEDLQEVVAQAEVIFCAVQTPHEPRFEGITPLPDERADFDYTHLTRAVAEINGHAAYLRKHVTLAVISTVLPGTMKREVEPLLGEYVSLVYNPSFIAMGTTIRDFLDPEFVLLGGDDEGKVAEVYQEILDPVPYYRTTVPDAELIKVAYNTFIGLKLAFANTLGEVCHKTDCDVDEVTGALKLAHRRLISPAYLDAGMGDGGGCFPAGELVLTEHGPRPIESIEPGDRVLAGDGILRPVVHRWERHYKGELVRVATEGMPETLATSDHPFYVAQDGRPPGAGRKHHPAHGSIAEHLKPLEELDGGNLEAGEHFVAWPHPLEDLTQEVPGHATPEYLELAGWYLAEGGVDKRLTSLGNVRSARVSFDLHSDEVAERERIAELLPIVAPPRESGRGAGAQPRTTVVENRANVRYGSVELAERLESDFGKGCAEKTIPSWILWGPLENASTLLQGMVMGDGHIGPTGIHFATTSRDLAYGVLVLYDRLGIRANLRQADRKNRLRQYEVRVRNGPDAVRCSGILGIPQPTEPRRGAERYADRGDGHLYRRIRKVERIPYSGPVYNLWVDEEHSYVTNAGRVANCHPRDNIALSWLARKLDLSYDIFEAAMRQRENHARWLCELMEQAAEERGLPMAILGTAYKPESHLTTGSPALLVSQLLTRRGNEVIAMDPWVSRRGTPGMWKHPTDPHVFLIGTKHPEFAQMGFPVGSVVIDPWRYIPDHDGVEVIRVGAGRD